MIDTLLTLLKSEPALSLFKLLGGGIGGAMLNNWYNKKRTSMQTMMCYYMDDEILSKIPQKHEDNTIHQNVYCKTFSVVNTTNRDISEFKVIFQFDATSKILECYSRSKEGYNRQKITVNKNNANEAFATIKHFNRTDKIEYVFQIADITDNKYYITESNCIGFKIKCKDKRQATNKSKSNQSDQILINRRI